MILLSPAATAPTRLARVPRLFTCRVWVKVPSQFLRFLLDAGRMLRQVATVSCLPTGAAASKTSGQSAQCREASERVHLVPGQSQLLFAASRSSAPPAGSEPTSPPLPSRTGLQSCLSAFWSENDLLTTATRPRVVQAQGPARRHWASQTSKPSLRKQQLGEHILDPDQ